MPVPMQTPYGPVDAVAAWLRANGIDPCDVPIEGPIDIEHEAGRRGWCIQYAALKRNEAGRIHLDPDTGGPATELRTAPLKVSPPKNVQVKGI